MFFQSFLIVLLGIIILALTGLVIFLKQKLDYYVKISNSLSVMSVVQKVFEILGSSISANKKIEELNGVIIDAYSPKYSSICVFDGNVHDVKASNVESTYIGSVAAIAEDSEFKNNAYRNVSKYMTTSQSKTLSYNSAMERSIRSALFSPIYYNGTYLGYWLLEDTVENAFDNISKDELSKLKNNLGVFLENTQYQDLIETAENTDKQTGLYNNLFLYSNARQSLLTNEKSAFILFGFKNLAEINDKFGRAIGNKFLIKSAQVLKEIFSKDTMHVRLSGLRFLSICPDSEAEAIHSLAERTLSKLKEDVEYIEGQPVNYEIQVVMHTFRRQNNIEKEVQKMVKYMDKMTESNTIKMI